MKLPDFTFDADDECATERFATALAHEVPDGCVIALRGTLGAGKTRLVRAIATACGVPSATVTSPTFTLVNEYKGDRNFYHLDAYRVTSEPEFLELGVEELFSSSAITLIEWADRVSACLPEDYLDIELEVTGASARRFHVRAVGAQYGGLVDHLAAELRR